MRDRLRHLEELYDGDASGGPPPDQDAAHELASLQQMKALLDARPRQAPDPSVVSAVLAAARGESVPKRIRAVDDRPVDSGSDSAMSSASRRRGDRLPVAREGSTVLRIGAASALVVVLLAVVGILHLEVLDPSLSRLPDETSPTAAQSDALKQQGKGLGDGAPRTGLAETAPERGSSRRDAGAPEPSDEREVERSSSVGESAETQSSFASQGRRALAEQAEPAFPELAEQTHPSYAQPLADIMASSMENASEAAQEVTWDKRAEVLEVYQHIEMVGDGVEQGWEPPSVPLEMLPQQGPESSQFLRQAGESRNREP